MKTKDLIYIALITISILIAIWGKYTQPKIAFVHTNDLLEDYIGMKEASDKYLRKFDNWQSSIDSLQKKLYMEINNYKLDSLKYTIAEKLKRKEKIRLLQYELQELNNKVKENLNNEDQALTMGVLNQVNSYIQEYGKRKSYTVIMGTLETGSILYGKEAIDITDEVLEGLNKNYLGE